MEVTNAAVLGQRAAHDMKRKRWVCSVEDPLMNGRKNGLGPNIKKSVPKNYLKFMKSALPQRVLSYESGEWTDFPEGYISLFKEAFVRKKAATEVDFGGRPSLLDFIHMILIDIQTGLQKPIAWIDIDGICYFPELHSVKDAHHEHFQAVEKENSPIKLQLEIKITTDAEWSEGSNSNCKRLKVDKNDSEKTTPEIKKVVVENGPSGFCAPNNLMLESLSRSLAEDAAKRMFTKGMSPSVCAENICRLQRSSSYWVKARSELFEKQIEIIGKYRGNANVRYAWLASSKEAVSRILMHGLVFSDLQKRELSFGTGVHLSALTSPHISASHCDIDENGVQHMVLCRVILGNMELIHRGSDQSYPSDDNFDSGVNDLTNPEHYTIWNMNMSTHIYPEYIISFKMPPTEKGQATGGDFSVKNSTVSQAIDVNIPRGRTSPVKFAGRPPKSAWVPLPMLLAKLKDKLPHGSMKLVSKFYGEFKNNKISRHELIQRMRSISGDALLKAAIYNHQGKE
ncbi:hypothetical protein ACHQM5_018510 [Ranunculus cassubicifolius]